MKLPTTKPSLVLTLILAIGGLISADTTAKEWKETINCTEEPMTSIGRNDYFILEPGYQLVLEGKEHGKKVILTITVLHETQKIGNVETRVVEERETAGDKLVEVSRNFFAVGTQTKNVYYFGEEVDVYRDNKVVHEGAWREGQGEAKRGIAMPGAFRNGDKYYQEHAPKIAMDRAENVTTNERVKTPIGDFEHCLKVKETTPLEPGTENKYYARDVGLVREGDLFLVRHGYLGK